MRGRIAGAAIAAAMVTAMIAATPALASPLGTTVSAAGSTALTSHEGFGEFDDNARPAVQYALDLVDAWGEVDTAKVDMMATAEVAATLMGFANPADAAWFHTNSRAIAGIMFSSFVNKDVGQALVIGVEEGKVGGDHAAVIARFVDLPQSRMTAVEYAKQLVAAWGNGDTDQVNKLATDEVAATLLDFANPGGTAWRHTNSREIAGVMFSSFVDRTQGKSLVIGVQKSAIGGDDAAIFAWFADYTMNRIDRHDNVRWHHGDRDWSDRH